MIAAAVENQGRGRLEVVAMFRDIRRPGRELSPAEGCDILRRAEYRVFATAALPQIGLINAAEEYASRGYNEVEVQKKIATIPEKLLKIFRVAEARGITTAEAGDLLVEQRMSHPGNGN